MVGSLRPPPALRLSPGPVPVTVTAARAAVLQCSCTKSTGSLPQRPRAGAAAGQAGPDSESRRYSARTAWRTVARAGGPRAPRHGLAVRERNIVYYYYDIDCTAPAEVNLNSLRLGLIAAQHGHGACLSSDRPSPRATGHGACLSSDRPRSLLPGGPGDRDLTAWSRLRLAGGPGGEY